MQVNVNQDTAIRQYTQNVQSAKAVTAPVTATKEEASADAVQKDVDRAEFSKDTAVTGKMSDSERSALVQSLKDDLNNQMSPFHEYDDSDVPEAGNYSKPVSGK